jgi:hypothetical protein
MYYYQISKSSQPISDSIMYTTEFSDIKIRCCNIHTNGWTIALEKYSTSILVWNRKTKRMQYLKVNELNSSDIRIVLFDCKSPIRSRKYCKFTLSWSHIKSQHIFTEADHLIVKLDDRFSYDIQSTMITDSVYSI